MYHVIVMKNGSDMIDGVMDENAARGIMEIVMADHTMTAAIWHEE